MLRALLIAVATVPLIALSACDPGRGIEQQVQEKWDTWTAQEHARYLGRPVEDMYGEWGVPNGRAPTSSGWFYEFQQYFGQYRCAASVRATDQLIITQIEISGQRGCARYQ